MDAGHRGPFRPVGTPPGEKIFCRSPLFSRLLGFWGRFFRKKVGEKFGLGGEIGLSLHPLSGRERSLGEGGRTRGRARFFDTDETRKDKQRRASGMFFFCGTPGSPGEDNNKMDKRDTYNAEFDPGSG